MQSFRQAARFRQAITNAVDLHVTQPSDVAFTKDAEKANLDDATSPAPSKIVQGNIATFDGLNDPEDPHNWPASKKATVALLVSAIAFIVGFASSIDSGIIPQASRTFHVSETAESLATVVFLLGFGVGAPFAGPLSEAYGRSPVYLGALTCFCAWLLGAALAPNFGAQLAFRFLAGCCGAAPFTTTGGTMADVFDHGARARIFPFFACVAFVGPMIGPLVGAYIGGSGLDWRWTEWMSLIIAAAILFVMLLFMPETHAPTLLGWKARALRDAAGGRPAFADVRGPLEVERTSLGRTLADVLTRPFVILFTEPIVLAFTLYLALVYVVAFSFFTAAPAIFGETYGFAQGASYLMFVSIVVGLVACAAATPLFGILVGREMRKAASRGQAHADPEAMLMWAMVGAPFLPISLFWMAWTSYPSISYWSPLISAGFFGFSILCIFISTYAYLIQSYASYAASALVAITLVRYGAGGAMVIVSIPMYQNLGVHDSLTILGAIACAFTPIPYLLYAYGYKLRNVSRRAAEGAH